MNREQIMEIVQKNVHEVLDKYLSDKLLYVIEREITNSVEWDLYHQDDEAEG